MTFQEMCENGRRSKLIELMDYTYENYGWGVWLEDTPDFDVNQIKKEITDRFISEVIGPDVLTENNNEILRRLNEI